MVNSTSLDLRQCQNANSRPYCQPRGLLQQYILYQVAAVHRCPLQSAINAAARLVVKWDSITSTLRDTLHWLLVRQRINIRLSSSLQMAPPACRPVPGVNGYTRQHVVISGRQVKVIWKYSSRTGTVGFGPRSFSVASCWSITVEYFTVTRNCLL